MIPVSLVNGWVHSVVYVSALVCLGARLGALAGLAGCPGRESG